MKQYQAPVQKQRQVLSLRLQRSLSILSMNQSELNEHILEMYNQNPLLEADWSVIPTYGESLTPFDAYTPGKVNFRDDLIFQLHVTTNSAVLTRIGEYLIDSLDEHGYLDDSVSRVAAQLRVPVRWVRYAVRLVQSLEPAGICARNLQESLYLQLKRQPKPHGLALRVVLECMDHMEAMNVELMAKKLSAPAEAIRLAIAEIRKLNPYPVMDATLNNIPYCAPELLVYIRDDMPVVSPMQRTPALSLYSLSDPVIYAGDICPEALRLQLSEARFLISSVEQRQRTMMRIAQQIVLLQKDFFLSGAAPGALTLEDVAGLAGISVSTVSRTVSGKYLQFGIRVYPMRYFFSPRVATGNSREQVKEVIISMIQNEDPAHAVSDAQMARYFQTNGQPISRRTITKYRQAMNIPQASQRHAL